MKVRIVYEQNYDDYTEHGIFSTLAKAEAYVELVAEAEKLGRVRNAERANLQISEEQEVDEFEGAFAVFSFRGYRKGADMKLHILYLTEVPATQFFDDNGSVFSVQAYGLTPAEAKQKLAAAKIEAFGPTKDKS